MTPREWLLTRARGSQGVLATSTGCMQLVCRIIVVRFVRSLVAKCRACKKTQLEKTRPSDAHLPFSRVLVARGAMKFRWNLERWKIRWVSQSAVNYIWIAQFCLPRPRWNVRWNFDEFDEFFFAVKRVGASHFCICAHVSAISWSWSELVRVVRLICCSLAWAGSHIWNPSGFV